MSTGIGTGNSTGVLTTTITTTATVPSGGDVILVVGRFAGSPGATITPTSIGSGWTTDRDSGAASARIMVFRARVAAGLASSSTITITHSNSCDCIAAAVYDVLDNSTPVTTANSGSGSTAAWSSGAVAGNSGDMLFGACFIDNGATTSSSPGGGATEKYDLNVGAQSETLVAQEVIISGSTSLTGTWNAAGGWVAAAVAYKLAAAAPSPQANEFVIVAPNQALFSTPTMW
jgi:hypothetical protein